MAEPEPSFDELVEIVRKLPREKQERLFAAVGFDTGRSGERPAPAAGAEYHCGACGALLPVDELPDACPSCGASRDSFVLEAED